MSAMTAPTSYPNTLLLLLPHQCPVPTQLLCGRDLPHHFSSHYSSQRQVAHSLCKKHQMHSADLDLVLQAYGTQLFNVNEVSDSYNRVLLVRKGHPYVH
jgi:hypothetical protein